MSSGPQNQPNPSGGVSPDPFEQVVTDGIKQLVNLGTIGNDLTRATNYLLMGGKGSGGYGGGGGGSGNDLDRLFAQYFGRESKTVDPQKGLGRYAGKKLGQAWRGSRSRNWGKTAAKFGRGLARTLGGGKKTTEAMGSVAGVMGKVAGAAVSVVEAFVKVYDAVDKYTEAQFVAAARIAENSGDLARVMADREVNQIARDMQRSARTASSYDKLQKAESARKDAENELGAVADNAVNRLLAFGNQVLTPVLEGMNMMLEAFEKLPGGVGDIIKELRKGDAAVGDTFGDAGRATRDVEMMDDAARRLMEIARKAAGDFGSGSVALSGAARPGGLLP